MSRSRPVRLAYIRKRRGTPSTPALSSESAAAAKLEPCGIVTRRTGASSLPHAAPTATIRPNVTPDRRRRGSARQRCQGMLQENGCGQRINVSATSARRPFHLTNGAERCRGRVPLVHQRHRQARATLELGPNPANFFAARCLVALVVQRETEHERGRLQRLRLPHEL